MKKIDPVCGMEVAEENAAATSVFKGELYLFCAIGCKRRFDKDPESFLNDDAFGTVSLHLPISHSNHTEIPPTQAPAISPTPTPDPPGGPGPTEKMTFQIGGMTCASCVRVVEETLSSLPGVLKAAVNLTTESATVEFQAGTLDPGVVKEAVSSTGYSLLESHSVTGQARSEDSKLKWDLIGSIALTLPILILNMFFASRLPWANILLVFLTAPVLFWFGRRFFLGFVKTLRHMRADMNTLIALGTVSAYGYSVFVTFFPEKLLQLNQIPSTFFDTSAVIITLVLTGRFLESGAKRKASEAIRQLQSLSPDVANLVTGGKETPVPVGSLQPGQIVRIRPGDKIPSDGVIMDGSSSLDQATITGESLPVDKMTGDEVFGGTLNLSGTFLMEIRSRWVHSLLGNIVRSVEETELSKVPVQRLADRVAAWFVPAVLVIASLTFIYWAYFSADGSLITALLSFVAVLTVACPCALGLATPTAIVVSKGTAARVGIIIKNLEKLEIAHLIDTAVFDKTGTITSGNVAVSEIKAIGSKSGYEILSLAASLEQYSEHPIGKAILLAAQEAGLELKEATGFKNSPGIGIDGLIDCIPVSIASPNRLPRSVSTNSDTDLFIRSVTEKGQTAVCVVEAANVIGVITLEDSVKPHASGAIKKLSDLGIRAVMITGDNEAVAGRVAASVGIGEVHANLLPSEKSDRIVELQKQGKRVAMVGDGVNDAPALVHADLGIALGTGTDIAKNAGDITILFDDLSKVSEAIIISKNTMRIIRQNLFWAFAYNVALIPLAAAGVMNPMFAAAAMAFSSLSVVGNSLRLRGKGGT